MEINIRRGLDLKIAGAVTDRNVRCITPTAVAIYPEDYHGFSPKADVNVGDRVMVGSPLFHDKNCPELTITSPVSGHVTEVERGQRRKLIKVVIANDGLYSAIDFKNPGDDAANISRLLAESGLMVYIHRRPYDVVARPTDAPRDIFVSAFDSAPLAVTHDYTVQDARDMEQGVSILSRLTTGNIYISRRSPSQLPDIAGCVMVDVKGPHPAGNTGVQIANISPVNKGENVWTLSADTLRRIGELFTTWHVDFSTRVALTGSRLSSRGIVSTPVGAPVSALLDGCLDNNDAHRRIISGNVLTGIKVNEDDGHLRFPYTQITAIPEGDDVDEFMGWASVSPSKMSINPSFPGRLFRRMFNPDARVLGGRRAMIMSGQIDRVLPMDIMGEYLIKAAKSHDIDRMEQLGIYEVAPEDFALAECIDSSKMPYQAIIRESLDYLRGELE